MSLESSVDRSGPITFEDLGITRRPHTQDTILGKSRTWGDISKTEVAFVVISLISLITAAGLTIYNAAWQFEPQSSDFTFALLLLVQICFCIYYIVDGVLRERPYEIAVFIGGAGILIIYILINFIATKGWLDGIKLGRLIVILVLGPVDIALGIPVVIRYYTSGNLIFRTIGANADLQEACKTLFFFETLLKLDLQLEVSLLILVLKNGTIIGLLQKIVLGVGFGVSIIWIILGYCAARFESKVVQWIFLVTSWMEPAYIIYIIVKASEHLTAVLTLSIATYVGSACALVIRVMVVIWMVRVSRNFGTGLKEKAFSHLCTAIPGSHNPTTKGYQTFHAPTREIFQQEPILPDSHS